MKDKLVTSPAPNAPPDAPTDWNEVVYGNRFQNIERLGQWIGGTAPVKAGDSPSGNFRSVTANSLGSGANPPTIYVLIHGWAPGYRSVVKRNNGKVRWWDPDAFITKKNHNGTLTEIWTSDWAWSAVSAPLTPSFTVNPTGLLQSIKAFDPKATILAYSWLDDSATDSGFINLGEVYRSEAYTHANGLRLVDALLTAIDRSFWKSGGKLRLIGHSHGSKVATVAALTLQQLKSNAAALTILDSPEVRDETLYFNAANMLGYYLQRMTIADPMSKNPAGTFVDNCVSCFGVGYADSNNIVEVSLDAKALYGNWATDWANEHMYAAAWYGASYAGSKAQSLAPLGFAMPPVSSNYQTAFRQSFTSNPSQWEQWTLQPGQPDRNGAYRYTAQALTVKQDKKYGNMLVLENKHTGATESISFGALNNGKPAMYRGSYKSSSSKKYGIAMDIQWSAAQSGDYLVMCAGTPLDKEYQVLFVMDGQSALSPLTTSVAINCSEWSDETYISLFYVPSSKKTAGKITVSNFQSISVGGMGKEPISVRHAQVGEKEANALEETPAEVPLPNSKSKN